MNDNNSRFEVDPRAGQEILDMVLTADNLQLLRDERQRAVLAWCEATFGIGPARDFTERALRVVEEAIELAQVEGVGSVELHRLVEHVYSKAPGIPPREVGGVGVTLLAYCEARGLSAERCERNEFIRASAQAKEKSRERQTAKAEAGVARWPE